MSGGCPAGPVWAGEYCHMIHPGNTLHIATEGGAPSVARASGSPMVTKGGARICRMNRVSQDFPSQRERYTEDQC